MPRSPTPSSKRDIGGMALSGSRVDFRKLIAEETEKWAKVVKFAGIKAE